MSEFRIAYQLRGPDDTRWSETQARIVTADDVSLADKKVRQDVRACWHIRIMSVSMRCESEVGGGTRQCRRWASDRFCTAHTPQESR